MYSFPTSQSLIGNVILDAGKNAYDRHNASQSLIGNVIHSFKKDEDLDKWFPDYLSQSLIGNVIRKSNKNNLRPYYCLNPS